MLGGYKALSFWNSWNWRNCRILKCLKSWLVCVFRCLNFVYWRTFRWSPEVFTSMNVCLHFLTCRSLETVRAYPSLEIMQLDCTFTCFKKLCFSWKVNSQGKKSKAAWHQEGNVFRTVLVYTCWVGMIWIFKTLGDPSRPTRAHHHLLVYWLLIAVSTDTPTFGN